MPIYVGTNGVERKTLCIDVNATVSIYLRTSSVLLAGYTDSRAAIVRLRYIRDREASGLGIRVSKAIAEVISTRNFIQKIWARGLFRRYNSKR